MVKNTQKLSPYEQNAFIVFEDEDGSIKQGYFELLEKPSIFVKIKSEKNIIFIPYNRVRKIKLKGGNKE